MNLAAASWVALYNY